MEGQRGWENGGKQYFFGVITFVATGGSAYLAGKLTLLGGLELIAAADDISAGFYADGTTLASNLSELTPETIDNIKGIIGITGIYKDGFDLFGELMNNPKYLQELDPASLETVLKTLGFVQTVNGVIPSPSDYE